MRMSGGVLLLVLALGLAGCGSSSPPLAPSSVSRVVPPTYTLTGVVSGLTPAGLVPLAGVSVQADLYMIGVTDANGVYTLTGLPAVSGIVVTTWKPSYVNQTRTVALGGETRLDFQLARLATFTLSGVVSEMTSTGPAPVEGVQIDDWSCDPAFPGNRPRNPSDGCLYGLPHSATTDSNGRYSMSGVYATVANSATQNFVCATKAGYQGNMPGSECGGYSTTVTVDGDTRFAIQLVRR